MPQFSVRLNERNLGQIGGPDFFTLNASVISGQDGQAWLSVYGTRVQENGSTEFVDWLSQRFFPGDQLEIEYRLDESTPRQVKPDLTLLQQQMDNLAEELQEIRECFERKEPNPPQSPRSKTPVVFEIETKQAGLIGASLGGEEQLQATLTFVGDHCIFDVAALTALVGGSTKGRHWLHAPISSGGSIRVAYAT